MIRIAVVALALAATSARADTRGYTLKNENAKRPAPLIVALHCYSCPPTYLPEQLQLEQLAKQQGALLAIPAGYTDKDGNPFWNATSACCDFDGKKPDDVGYIARVIDDAVKTHGADPKRVYLIGFSNGGFLAHRLACELPGKVAAIASINGAAPEVCTPSSPVAVLEVHGKDDTVVPAAGGTVGGDLPKRARIPSAREALEKWARVDGCDAPDSAGHRRCQRGAVELWMLPGGHLLDFNAALGERVWKWLAAQHK